MDTCNHTHTPTPAQARMLTSTQKQKQNRAILDLALWTYGAVCIDLLVWVAMQCKNRFVFCRMTSPFPLDGPHSPTLGPGYTYSLHETTLTYTDHMNTGTHTHTRTGTRTHSYGRSMQC